MFDLLTRWRARRSATMPRRGNMIAFVGNLPRTLRVQSEETYTSALASNRLRVLIPARELSRRIPVWLVPYAEFSERPDLSHLGEPLAIVITKLASKDVVAREAQLRTMIARLRKGPRRLPLYADLSDDYGALAEAMREPFLRDYPRLLGRVCELTVPTAALGAAVRKHARLGVHVIEDPFESPVARPVKATSSNPLRLAWFGMLSVTSLTMIERELQALAGGLVNQAVVLEIVAWPGSREAVQAMAGALRQVHPRFALSFTPWSLAATESAIERSDFIWLPQDHRSAWGRVKSHNRLVSAIRGGRLALASPIPAYRELAAHAWVGEDLAQGLAWALANPVAAAQRVASGQRYVEARFSPAAVAQRWAEVLGVSQYAPPVADSA